MKKTCLAFLPLLAGCVPVTTHQIEATGRIASAEITEASGLAQSTLHDDLLWVINDGGSPPVLHAVGVDGSIRGSVRLVPADNVDWEAIASFRLDNQSWLLVADVGDNQAIRQQSTLYVLEEPDLDANPVASQPVAWSFSFRWPEGPRDCEAVAVDVAGERILLLSKRTVPAELYELPLRPASAEVQTARRVGSMDVLPQPTAEDLRRAPLERNWHWQPTAMDISRDGKAAAILTYRAVYYFTREGDEAWLDALHEPAAIIDLGDIREAEGIAFREVSGHGRDILVTVEAPHAPLYLIRHIQ